MNESKPEKDKSLEQQCVCPSWFCFTFDNPVRRLLQNPERILKPHIKPGWTVLDVGPGMGYFTVPLAKLVGDKGKVIAADLQVKMLEGIRRRAKKAGVAGRIDFHLSQPDGIGVSEAVDFCLAFWMVHEVPDRERFVREIAACLKPGGLFLFVEPRVHVSKKSFNATLEIAKGAGLTLVEKPIVFFSYAALLKK
jgi:ubiquinone/menaquinone biosynthesis C-methylase UbiE